MLYTYIRCTMQQCLLCYIVGVVVVAISLIRLYCFVPITLPRNMHSLRRGVLLMCVSFETLTSFSVVLVLQTLPIYFAHTNRTLIVIVFYSYLYYSVLHVQIIVVFLDKHAHNHCFANFQDPTELSKFNLADFYHLKKGLKVDDEGLLARLFYVMIDRRYLPTYWVKSVY